MTATTSSSPAGPSKTPRVPEPTPYADGKRDGDSSSSAEVVRFQSPVLPALSEIDAYFSESRRLGWYANSGPCHSELERRAGALLDDRPIVPVSSAGLGLVLALRALVGEPTPERREVIVPSFTFAASAAAIVWAGLHPVFCDIDPDTWHLSPTGLRDALDDRRGRVAAVLACTTFGTPPPEEQLSSWATDAAAAGVPLLVDAAAALGTSTPGYPKPDAEIFSMHATKPMPIGEGGLVVLRDSDVWARVRVLANHGLDDSHTAVVVGLNAKLDEWHCATALAGLDRLADTLHARQERAAAIRRAVADLDISFQLGAEQSSTQFVPALMSSTAARQRLVDVARARGVQTRTYFDPPLHRMPAYERYERADELRVTDQVAARVVSLPMATDMTATEIERIVACLRLSA